MSSDAQMSIQAAYEAGREAGRAATRSVGGSHGAEWSATARGLTGVRRSEFIQGFNEELDAAEAAACEFDEEDDE